MHTASVFSSFSYYFVNIVSLTRGDLYIGHLDACSSFFFLGKLCNTSLFHVLIFRRF